VPAKACIPFDRGVAAPMSGDCMVPSEQPVQAFVINLARSADRLERITASVPGSGLAIQRIGAIDGSQIVPERRSDLNLAKFRRWHGRNVLDGEYGCYRSHIIALSTVVQQNLPIAIIAEDDIVFTRNLGMRVGSLMHAQPGIDVLKLVNHRVSGFISHGRSALGDEFGRCVHGPQGSAACYAVTRKGAADLLSALSVMWLPYDIALERGYSTGVSTYTTREPLVVLEGHRSPTTIATRDQYRAAKLPKIMQITTACFRGWDYLRRTRYAMMKA